MNDTFTLEVRLELFKFLNGLPETCGRSDPVCGICGCVTSSEISDGADALFDKVYDSAVAQWEHYSGIIGYPVPDPDSLQNVDAAVTRYQKHRERHWSKRSRYGRLRRDLAKFLANKALYWGVES